MSEESTERIKEVIDLIDQDFLDPSVIMENVLYFQFNNKSYRSVMPSPKDLSEAEVIKNQTYGKLLNTEGYHLLDNLKKILKEKQNVDIDAMYTDKDLIIKSLEDKLIQLASYGDSKDLDKVDSIKDDIDAIKLELRDLTLVIERYLFPSIEKQMEARYLEYLTYLCSEVLVEPKEEKYERVWDNIEVFEADRSNLPIKALNNVTKLLLNSREIL